MTDIPVTDAGKAQTPIWRRPGSESQLCPTKQFAPEHITSCLWGSATPSANGDLDRPLFSERTTNFWLNKAASFTPTESHFCIIVIIQYNGNDVLLICVRVAVSFINHKWELHGHSHSLVFPVGNRLLIQCDIPHGKHKTRGAPVPQPCHG